MERAILLVIAVCISGISGLAGYALKQEYEWHKFAAAHDCKLVKSMPEHMVTTASFNPVTRAIELKPMYTSGEKTYACNDGREYIR